MSSVEGLEGLGGQLVQLMSCVERVTERAEHELPSVDHLVWRWGAPGPATVLSMLRAGGPTEFVEPFETWRQRLGDFDAAIADLTRLRDGTVGDGPDRQLHLNAAIENARRCRQEVEEAAEALRRLLRATIDSLLSGGVGPKPASSSAAHGAPVPRDGEHVWSIEIVFTEDEDRTRADARMRATRRDWHGWGRARRNPSDPDIPAVGEELAAARAISDLAHQLVDAAAHEIERFEGHPVRVHS